MKEIFYHSPNVTQRKSNLSVHSRNRSKFGNKCLRSHWAYIWNSLHESIKSTKLQNKSKDFLKK